MKAAPEILKRYALVLPLQKLQYDDLGVFRCQSEDSAEVSNRVERVK